MTTQERIAEALWEFWVGNTETAAISYGDTKKLAERIERFGVAIARHYCWALTGDERKNEIEKGLTKGIKALEKEA